MQQASLLDKTSQNLVRSLSKDVPTVWENRVEKAES